MTVHPQNFTTRKFLAIGYCSLCPQANPSFAQLPTQGNLQGFLSSIHHNNEAFPLLPKITDSCVYLMSTIEWTVHLLTVPSTLLACEAPDFNQSVVGGSDQVQTRGRKTHVSHIPDQKKKKKKNNKVHELLHHTCTSWYTVAARPLSQYCIQQGKYSKHVTRKK